MFFRKKKVHDSAKKFDKLITWLIIWWAVASMVWLSKTNKWKEITKNIKTKWSWVLKKWVSWVGQVLAWTVNFFTKKK